jgi:hypothetical protein
LVSRWLREERGGREEHGGWDRVVQPNIPSEHQNRGPTDAELAGNTPQKIPNANNHTIMTRQWHSMPIHDTQPHQPPIITKNQNEPSYSHQKTINLNINSTNTHGSFPFIKRADNPFNSMSNLYHNTHNLPIIVSRPETENVNCQSLLNQSMVFTSQPNTQDPP